MTNTTYLTVTKGLYGYMVVQVWTELNSEDENDIFAEREIVHTERLGGDMHYQFDTEEEAILNFENWAGDNWEDTPRAWLEGKDYPMS